MSKRTEEDKILQNGIKVILGGKEYSIRPLVIRYSGAWRKKSIPLVASLMRFTSFMSEVKPGNTEGLEQAVTEMFTTRTDEMLDSFFEYARELNREEIEGIATDGEVIDAFMEVFNAFVAPLSVTPAKGTETAPVVKSSSSS